jgi:hypothetical protein
LNCKRNDGKDVVGRLQCLRTPSTPKGETACAEAQAEVLLQEVAFELNLEKWKGAREREVAAVIPATQEAEIGRSRSKANPGKSMRCYLKN